VCKEQEQIEKQEKYMAFEAPAKTFRTIIPKRYIVEFK
jgi:hypothetical protein